MQRSDPSDHQWEAGQAARGGTAWGAALATVGLTLTTGGAALVLGSSAVPELAEIGARLAESGVRSGVVIVGGLVLTGLGIVLGRVSAISGQLRSAEEAMEVTRTLSLSMRHLVERVARLSDELGELRESDRALLHAAQELLDDRQLDVGLQEAHAHVAERGLDVVLAQLRLALELEPSVAEALAEGLEHLLHLH